MSKRVVRSWQPISLHWPSLTNKHGRVVALCTAMPTTALKRPYLNPNAHYEPAVRFPQEFFISSGRRERCWRLRCTLLYIKIRRLLQLRIATGKRKRKHPQSCGARVPVWYFKFSSGIYCPPVGQLWFFHLSKAYSRSTPCLRPLKVFLSLWPLVGARFAIDRDLWSSARK